MFLSIPPENRKLLLFLLLHGLQEVSFSLAAHLFVRELKIELRIAIKLWDFEECVF